MSAQLESLRRHVARTPPPAHGGGGPSRVVVLGGGKGGVGTSLVSALLAVSAAARGDRVLLVDADTSLGSLHLLFGLESGPGLGALRGAELAPDALAVPVTETLALIPGGGAEAGALSPVERQALFRRLAPLYEGRDLVVVDGGSRLDSVMAACAGGAARLLTVTTRDRIALTATYALVKVAGERFPGMPLSVLVNRDDAEAGKQLFDEVEGAARHFLRRSVSFAGTVPEDPCLHAGIEAGMSLHDIATESPAADAAGLVCATLVQQSAAGTPSPAARHHLHWRS